VASTITVQSTLNWVAIFIMGRPTTGVLSFANEPGLTAANYLLQTITNPPFKWSWNRKEITTLSTVAGTTDYSVAISDFGFLEKCAVDDGGSRQRELQIYQNVPLAARDKKQSIPKFVTVLLDDNAGNITFRFSPPPDAVYNVTFTYQKAVALITALTATWTPIPDKLAYLYERGMLALLQGMYSPQLAMQNTEYFFRQLIGASEGLTESEKNIFLEDKMREFRIKTNATGGGQQGGAQ